MAAWKVILQYQFMEEALRSNSRVSIHDKVYDKIMQQRYGQHRASLDRIQVRKSNSDYQLGKYNYSNRLDIYKKKSQKVKKQLQSIDAEPKNCFRKVKHIENTLKLPKVNNVKLHSRQRVIKNENERIFKENTHLQQKIKHIQIESKQKLKKLSNSINQYEQFRRLSRRHNEKPSGHGPSRSNFN